MYYCASVVSIPIWSDCEYKAHRNVYVGRGFQFQYGLIVRIETAWNLGHVMLFQFQYGLIVRR